jgi:hypothetical protein
MRTHGRLPLAQRVLLLLTGFFTILCTGGCGFDGQSEQASDGTSEAQSGAVIIAAATIGSTGPADEAPGHSDCDCGCISCSAVPPFAITPRELPSLIEAASFGDGSTVSETSSVPLVPPPQL